VERKQFPTRSPDETLRECAEWLRERNVDAVGIASFGPVDLAPTSRTYGFITTTPKPGWQNADVLGTFRRALGPSMPIEFDTDVQAAALGELRHGRHEGELLESTKKNSASSEEEHRRPVQSLCYVTVGTGIGVGVVVSGSTLRGLLHPEGGHIRVSRAVVDRGDGRGPQLDDFEGICPFHGGKCLEGLCSAPALAARLGIAPAQLEELADDHWVWTLAADYLGQLCATITLLLSPEVIVLGGGVLQRTSLFPRIRDVCLRELAGYVQVDKILNRSQQYIVRSVHDDLRHAAVAVTAGSVGAIELAAEAWRRSAATASAM
jgi:fructokinase